jgi:ubiquitin carboxyl-terminal hydrolase 10
MRNVQPADENSTLPSPTSSKNGAADEGWTEVTAGQRHAVTRSSGHSGTSTPVTKIFGGQLRSELKVTGRKNISVTLEPYQPLQLDIGAPDVKNITDALKNLTRLETLHGDFKSDQGADARATKQVLIETLPPVLILHLKRFQFHADGHGTVKIWKKIGYPLELEIPNQVLSKSARGNAQNRYRLTAVVYHHGKNASGGHYTVDVRRQDGVEWIRLDDTVIRRLRSEDVAAAGADEESPKANAVDARKQNGASGAGTNQYSGLADEDAGEDDGWKTAASGSKRWSSVVNGGAVGTAVNGPKAKQVKESVKDNKVAYLLFYERI